MGAGAAPILFELWLVELCPRQDETQLAARQAALDHLQLIDTNLGLALGMAGMEMRVAMVVKYISMTIPKKLLMRGIEPLRLLEADRNDFGGGGAT
ncbi:MAG: hypothetical protein WB507_01860 [Solirubrobacterales bacterium]